MFNGLTTVEYKLLEHDKKFDEVFDELQKNQKIHNRFIVIDDKELYHVGASLKDLGKKCFAISKIEDIEYIEKISKLEVPN